MRRALAIFCWVIAATTATAQDTAIPDAIAQWEVDRRVTFDATLLDLDDFIWIARPVVIFADSPNDPRFSQQIDLLLELPDELATRDVIVLTDTDPSANSALRMRLRPRGFMMVLIGKDGEVELRKPSPLTVREITRSIDKMPLRRQEVEDRRVQP